MDYEVKEAMQNEIKNELLNLGNLAPSDDGYKQETERISKLLDSYVRHQANDNLDMENIRQAGFKDDELKIRQRELDIQAQQLQLKKEQLEHEKKQAELVNSVEEKGNWLSFAGNMARVVVELAVPIVTIFSYRSMVNMGFKFEQTGSIASYTGKSIFNGFPKPKIK